MSRADSVVLGAGPAGLGAAYRLAARGFRVTVVERQDRIGGLAGSFEVAGQRVDHRSHRPHPSTPPTILSCLRSRLGVWRVQMTEVKRRLFGQSSGRTDQRGRVDRTNNREYRDDRHQNDQHAG